MTFQYCYPRDNDTLETKTRVAEPEPQKYVISDVDVFKKKNLKRENIIALAFTYRGV
jgi:hypothetical protein